MARPVIQATYRAAGRSPAPFGMRKIHGATDFEYLVADATADAPGVPAALNSVTTKISASATAALASAPVTNRSTMNLRQKVAESIRVKTAKEFFRGMNSKNGRKEARRSKNTRIPVMIVVADSDYSRYFEFGTATRIPATHFMLKGGVAGNSRLGRFSPRGRSKGGL